MSFSGVARMICMVGHTLDGQLGEGGGGAIGGAVLGQASRPARGYGGALEANALCVGKPKPTPKNYVSSPYNI